MACALLGNYPESHPLILRMTMRRILTYQIYPTIPAELSFLEILARNLWWCWKPEAEDLFRRIDPQLWKATNNNPVQLLAQVDQKRLEKLVADDSFLAHLQRVKARFEERVTYNIDTRHPINASIGPVAYFSMEFGIHESIPIFAGGLGILAGDHLKAASNMALPLVGVGLLYRKGYLRQLLTADGWQQEEYPEIEFYNLPIERARGPEGEEISITLNGPDGQWRAFVWKLHIGRTILYLLDSNLLENPPAAREITARLYAGEPRIRLAQEVLLGIGGMRALSQMGVFPSVCHMNEGHSAFSTLERLALFMQRFHIDLETAIQMVSRCTVFTTHTPVPAGHDSFPAELVLPHLRPLADQLGVDAERLLAWGQHPNADQFCRVLQRDQPPSRTDSPPHVGPLVARMSGRRGAHRPYYKRRACVDFPGSRDLSDLRTSPGAGMVHEFSPAGEYSAPGRHL